MRRKLRFTGRSRAAIGLVLATAVITLAVPGAANADPGGFPNTAPWSVSGTSSGSTSSNSSSHVTPNVVTPDAFACHLSANQPSPGGGYLFIAYGALNQCSGVWYDGTVCVRLMGETHTGGAVSTGAYKCKTGTAYTISVQTEADCPANPAYYYYSNAKVTEVDEGGTQSGSTNSTATLGSNMCA
jgi:hypothetical protein